MTNPIERTRLQALLAVANAHLQNGWAARAAPLLREAEQLPMLRETAPNASLGAFHLAQARMRAVQGKMVAAKESYERAIHHFESDQPASALPLAEACIEFGDMLQDHRSYRAGVASGAGEAAPDWIGRGVQILEATASNPPKIAECYEKWLDSLHYHARNEECVEACLRRLAFLPESVIHSEHRATICSFMAKMSGYLGEDSSVAEEWFRRAIAYLEESGLASAVGYFRSLVELAEHLVEKRQSDEAEQLLAKACQVMLKSSDRKDASWNYPLRVFDKLLQLSVRPDFQLAYADRSAETRKDSKMGEEELQDLERVLEPDDPQWLVEIPAKLGTQVFREAVDDRSESTIWVKKALAIGRTTKEWNRRTAEAWFRILDNCFCCFVASAYLSEAEAILAELDGFLQAQPFLEKWDTLDLHLRLELENGRIEEASRKLEEDWNVANSCAYSKCERTYGFARLLEIYNHHSVAEQVIHQAIRLYEETNQDYPEGIDYYAVLARSLRGQGREVEAIQADTVRLSVAKRIGYNVGG